MTKSKLRYSALQYGIALLAFLFLHTASAQVQIYGKIKSPSKKKYHGLVLTYEPLDFVTMECQGDTMTFDLNNHDFEFTTRKPPKPYNFPSAVIYHRVSLGALSGNPSDGSFLSYSLHYQKTRLFGYGAGISYENYGDVDGYDFIVPRAVFLSYFTAKNSTPFIKLDAGYGIAIKNTRKFQSKASGGLNAGAELGYRLSSDRVMIDLTAGFRVQNGDFTFDFDDFTRVDDILFQRFVIGIGFMW